MIDDPTRRHSPSASAATESSNAGTVIKRSMRIGIPIVLLSVMTTICVGQLVFRSYEMTLDITVIPTEANTNKSLAELVQDEAAKIQEPEMIQSAVKSIQDASDAMTPPKREQLEPDLAKVEAQVTATRGRLALVTPTRSPVYTRQILVGLAEALKNDEDSARRLRLGKLITQPLDDPIKKLGTFAAVGAAIGVGATFALGLLITCLDRPRPTTTHQRSLEQEPS